MMGRVAGELRAAGRELVIASLTAPQDSLRQIRALKLRLYRLEDALIEQQTTRPMVDQLITLGAFLFEVRRDDLVGAGRLRQLVRARFAVVYAVLRVRPDFGTIRLGAALGGRDHSTIVSAYQSALRMRQDDEAFRDITDAIIAEFAVEPVSEGGDPCLL